MSIIWLIIIVLLFLIELIENNKITIFFVISAIISLITSFFIDTFLIQFIVFMVMGLFLMILLKDKLLKYFKRTNSLEKLLGKTAVVVKKVVKNGYGTVEINNKKYTAYSDDKINVNSKVIILEIKGSKLKVIKKD